MSEKSIVEHEIESVHSSYYDIFEKEVEDISTDSLQYIDYYDINLNDVNSVTDLLLEVKDNENWFIPSKAYLECRFSITHQDGTAIIHNENVSLQNNGVGLFNRWELLYDDDVVEFVDDAGIQNTVQSLVYFSKDYSDSIASNQFWYPDTANNSNFDYTIPIAAGADVPLFENSETINLGHRKRVQLSTFQAAATKQIVMHIPLRNVFGLLKSYSGVTRGMKFGIRLTRNDDSRILLCVGNNCTVVLNWVSLWMPRVKPHVTILATLIQKLSQDKIHFIPYVDTQIFRSNLINETANNKIFSIKTKRKRPIKVFIVFQNQNRVEGNQTFVKRIFDNVQLRNLRVVLNSNTQYPERPYICEFSNTRYDYARVYNALMRCGLKDHDIHEGSVVTYDNFPSLYPIFCVDLTEQYEYSVQPNSSIIDVYWSNDVVTNYYMYALVEAERELKVMGSNGYMHYIKNN